MKTIKTFKAICLVAILFMIAHTTVANSSSLSDAKRNLHDTLSETIKKDFTRIGNYLYENNIDYLEETVTVIVSVDNYRRVKLLRAKCDNCKATEYVEVLFSQNVIQSDPLLCGKKFIIDLRLLYIAK
ncbi:MAG: hypothetical protein RBS73_09390 [Prolixibacteraceae bacterium]|jgi:hypothetical protein|nr:hypothetical protein [Prolixibacteraceae bacterium]